MRVINTILNKFGYYKADLPEGPELSEKDVLELFSAYGDNETFLRLLRDTMARDVRLYFQASTDEDRFIIRGAYRRTSYFISLVRKANDKRNKGRKGN